MISFVTHNQLIDRWMIHQKSSWCVVLVFWGVGLGIVPWTTSILIGLKANIHTHSVPVRVTGQKRHWPLDLWPKSCLKANNVLARFDQSEFLFILLRHFIGCFLDHQSSGGKHETWKSRSLSRSRWLRISTSLYCSCAALISLTVQMGAQPLLHIPSLYQVFQIHR